MSELAPAHWMARALALAARGSLTSFPNPRVGCVIVRQGQVVGEGYHLRAGEPHAEVHALRQAGARARGADLFVTLEPCSHQGRTGPCADAVAAAGVRRVWAAMADPNPLVSGRGFQRLHEAGIEVHSGLLEGAARDLNRGFLSRMERQRPFVTLKLGASLDGRTAMASGESKWITGEAARADVQRLRAEAGAVLTGADTVRADDPQLNLRGATLPARMPDRIVLDSRRRVTAGARVWAEDGARRFWLHRNGLEPVAIPDGVVCVSLPTVADGRLDLRAALAALALHEINSVLVECGSTLAGAFLAAGLVDELICYVAPSLLGDQARGLAVLPGAERLSDRIALQFKDVRPIGPDLRITAVPATMTA